jgi:hypothetical protein
MRRGTRRNHPAARSPRDRLDPKARRSRRTDRCPGRAATGRGRAAHRAPRSPDHQRAATGRQCSTACCSERLANRSAAASALLAMASPHEAECSACSSTAPARRRRCAASRRAPRPGWRGNRRSTNTRWPSVTSMPDGCVTRSLPINVRRPRAPTITGPSAAESSWNASGAAPRGAEYGRAIWLMMSPSTTMSRAIAGG